MPRAWRSIRTAIISPHHPGGPHPIFRQGQTPHPGDRPARTATSDEFDRAELLAPNGCRMVVCRGFVQSSHPGIFAGRQVPPDLWAPGGPGEFSYPYDIRWTRPAASMSVSSAIAASGVFDASDHFLENHQLVRSRAIVWNIFDSEENLYVADSQNHRVQKFIRRKEGCRPVNFLPLVTSAVSVYLYHPRWPGRCGSLKFDVRVSRWRRCLTHFLRTAIVLALVSALAGLQWRKNLDGMIVYYLLDRSGQHSLGPAGRRAQLRQRCHGGEKAALNRAASSSSTPDASIWKLTTEEHSGRKGPINREPNGPTSPARLIEHRRLSRKRPETPRARF